MKFYIQWIELALLSFIALLYGDCGINYITWLTLAVLFGVRSMSSSILEEGSFMQESEEVMSSMPACSHLGGLNKRNRQVFENLSGDLSTVQESFFSCS